MVKINASSLDRVRVCPGSARLEQQISKEDRIPFSSGSAERGKRCHRLAQLRIDSTPCNDELLSADPAELGDADTALAMVKPMLEGAVHVNCETWYKSELLGSNVCIDVLAEYPDNSLLIVDYKFGSQYTEPMGQMYAYADAVLRDRHARGLPIGDVVRFVVPAPRFVYGDQCQTWKASPVEVARYVETEIETIKAEVNAENPTFKIGKHCHWCPVRHVCAQRTALVIEGVDMLEGASTGTPDNNKLSVMLDMLDVHLEHASNLKATLETIAEQRLNNSERIPGWGWVSGRGSRVWEDEKKAELTALAFGVDPYEKRLKTVPKMEKEVPEKIICTISKKIPGRRKVGRLPDAADMLKGGGK